MGDEREKEWLIEIGGLMGMKKKKKRFIVDTINVHQSS